jgi:hypothetical protein
VNHQPQRRFSLEPLESRLCLSAPLAVNGGLWLATYARDAGSSVVFTGVALSPGAVVHIDSRTTGDGRTFFVLSRNVSGTVTSPPRQVNDASAPPRQSAPAATAGVALPSRPVTSDDRTGGAVSLVDRLHDVLTASADVATDAFIGAAATASWSPASSASTALSHVDRVSGTAIAAAEFSDAVSAPSPSRMTTIFSAALAATAKTLRLTDTASTFGHVSTPAVATAARHFFGFTPLVPAVTLSCDPIASLVDDLASLTTPLLARARAQAPWALIVTVFAADVLLVAYIHREALRRRFSRFSASSIFSSEPLAA